MYLCGPQAGQELPGVRSCPAGSRHSWPASNTARPVRAAACRDNSNILRRLVINYQDTATVRLFQEFTKRISVLAPLFPLHLIYGLHLSVVESQQQQ